MDTLPTSGGAKTAGRRLLLLLVILQMACYMNAGYVHIHHGDMPLPCDQRFGEYCLPRTSYCENILTDEWAYCPEEEYLCCKDWAPQSIIKNKDTN